MEVDNVALKAVADALAASGAEVGESAKRLAETGFGPESVGSRYRSAGRDVDSGLRGIVEWLGAWRRAIDASAAGTGAGSVAYPEIDAEIAASLQRVSTT